jgi:hypothetical protein
MSSTGGQKPITVVTARPMDPEGIHMSSTGGQEPITVVTLDQWIRRVST